MIIRLNYKKVLDNILNIIDYRFWCMNNEYSKEWDDKLNDLLDNNKFTDIQEYVVYLGGYCLWIGNYPHACFTEVKDDNILNIFNGVRPSRQTIRKAGKLFYEQTGRKL